MSIAAVNEPSMSAPQGKKISSEVSVVLDFFRGVSAQLVVLGHLFSFYAIQSKYNLPLIQNFGVLVFFVLSGFLITNTTFNKGKGYGVKNYLIDRFSRIFYSFIPAIILVVFIDLLIINQGGYNTKFSFSIPSFISNTLMLQGYPIIGIQAFGSARPFWTVSVEWWLYITFGFLYYNFYHSIKPSIWWAVLLAFSVPLVLYYIGGHGGGLSIVWFMGFMLAVLYQSIEVKINTIAFLSILALCIVGVGYRTIVNREMYDLGIAIFFSLFIFAVFNTTGAVRKSFLNPAFVWISKFLSSYSYSLYLIHYSLIELYRSYFTDRSWVSILSIYIVVNIVSYIFYIFFEKNHVRLRNFLKRRIK